MKSINIFVLILCLSIFSILGCEINPEVVSPLKVTITGLPDPVPEGEDILSIGIFASYEDVMPLDVLYGEVPKEEMMNKAAAGGIAKIKDGKVIIELMDPVDQVNFITTGEYYAALMLGPSMDDLKKAYIYVEGEQMLKNVLELASVEDRAFLVDMIEQGGMQVLPTYNFSNESTIDLAECVDVTSMFHTLFGAE